MLSKKIADQAWRYFIHAPHIYPICSVCEIYVTHIADAYEVDVDVQHNNKRVHPKLGTVIICESCYDEDRLSNLDDECSLDELLEVMDAKGKVRACKEALEKGNKKKGKSSRKRAKAKRKSGSGDSSSGWVVGRKTRSSRSKAGRITKIREPKRK